MVVGWKIRQVVILKGFFIKYMTKKTNKIPERCPFCGIKLYGFIDGYQKHCVQKARHEVWQKSIGANVKTPHFDYYMKNTEPKSIITKRTWTFS